MVRSLDDHFVSPDPLNAERRELVRHHAHGPSRRVARRARPAIRTRPICLNLRRRLALVPVAEGTKSPLDLHVLAYKIGRALGPVRRNNDPTAYDRIFSKLRHKESFLGD